MKTIIYVFSGTGTSLATAVKIRDALGNTDIRSIPNELKKSCDNEIIPENSRIGIIFPCYFGEVPKIVIEFVKKLNLKNAEYIFSVVSAGGNSGYSLKILSEMIEKKGKKLNFGSSVIVSSNYIVAWYYDYVSKHGIKLENVIEKQNKKIAEMAEMINNSINKIEKWSYIFYKMPHLLTSKEIVKDTRKWDVEFMITEECIGCKSCTKVCPVNNIVMEKGKPLFTNNCQRCMACIQYCPKKAIGFEGKKLDKLRYFHPDFPLNKIIEFYENI